MTHSEYLATSSCGISRAASFSDYSYVAGSNKAHVGNAEEPPNLNETATAWELKYARIQAGDIGIEGMPQNTTTDTSKLDEYYQFKVKLEKLAALQAQKQRLESLVDSGIQYLPAAQDQSWSQIDNRCGLGGFYSRFDYTEKDLLVCPHTPSTINSEASSFTCDSANEHFSQHYPNQNSDEPKRFENSFTKTCIEETIEQTKEATEYNKTNQMFENGNRNLSGTESVKKPLEIISSTSTEAQGHLKTVQEAAETQTIVKATVVPNHRQHLPTQETRTNGNRIPQKKKNGDNNDQKKLPTARALFLHARINELCTGSTLTRKHSAKIAKEEWTHIDQATLDYYLAQRRNAIKKRES